MPAPPAFVERLRALCAIDTPTGELAGLRRAAALLAGWSREAGAQVEVFETDVGPHLSATIRGTGTGRTVLLGHLDTVFPAGTAHERPLRIAGDRALAPGAADMKGGLLVALHALERLARVPAAVHGEVMLHVVPDEEARLTPPHTLERLRGASACITLECGRENGAVVSARKAGTWLTISARGRAAHAGAAPERGRSALRALAAEALRIERELGGARAGMTCVVTEFAGGEGKNIVPAGARATLDLRAASAADLAWAMEQVSAFARHDGVELSASDDAGFPAMERDAALVERTLATLRLLGQPALEAVAGGVSDGSWTSSIGVPTIDGLGPVGGDDHTDAEWIDLRSVEPRIQAVRLLCSPDPVPGTRPDSTCLDSRP